MRLSIDGREVGGADGLVGFLGMAPFEGIDVGLDRKSPVDWSVYEREGTFAWTGELHSVTWVPGELAPDAGARWIDFLREQGRKFE